MSDCGMNRLNQKEDFQVVLGKENRGESSCQTNSRWLAHWTRASSSPYGKSCSPLEDTDNSTCTKDNGTSLFELKKSSVAERLILGGKYEGISMKNVQQLNSNMWGVAHDDWQGSEQKRIERRDGSFQSSVVQMQRNENFYAKTVVSETLSVRRLPDLPFDFQKLVNSDKNVDSHWNQLPMLSINQKVDSILNPKRKSAAGTVFSDLFVPQQTPLLNMAPSNLMELSHQEYELQSHRRTGRIMDHCKPAGGIIHLREDPTCLTSYPAGKKLKFDNNSLSDCLIDEQDTYHYFANPNQEPLWKCSEKMFDLSENNDKGQSVVGASQNQKSRTQAGLNGRQPLEKFMDSSKEKSPCLFEMLTTPSNLQIPYSKDSLYSGKPSGFGVCLYGPNVDSHLFGAQKQFSPKTEKLHSEAQYMSKSSAGITSLLAQMDNGCAEEANEQLAALSIKGSPGYNEESRLLCNATQDISSKQDLCTPGAEIMDLDPQPFQPSSTIIQVPNSATQSPMRTDPSYRWLKRLRHDVADDPRIPSPKRPKTGDCCPDGGASRMSDADIAEHVAARSVHCWLGRWCRDGGAPASHGDPEHRRRAAVKPGVATRELGVGGHFPSIKAMAMMGRVMSKVRPLDRQRKGPCVMWKTEGA
uniref:Uncharacterized protein n=1 Tax=Avena sativa TaxID=4498 RepID=A0ACD5T7N1_AVESA